MPAFFLVEPSWPSWLELLNDLLQLARDLLRAGAGRKPHRLADANLDRPRAREALVPQLQREQVVDAHGDDGQAEPLSEQADAGAEGRHLARRRAYPFREDEHAVAAVRRFARECERL